MATTVAAAPEAPLAPEPPASMEVTPEKGKRPKRSVTLSDAGVQKILDDMAPPVARAKPLPGGRRGPRPKLDFDEEMAKIAQQAKEAKKILNAHMADKRNAARRKSRLVKKASRLPTDDLYRIAVLKRCGHLERFFGSGKDGDPNKAAPLSDEDKKMAMERLQNLLGEDVEINMTAASSGSGQNGAGQEANPATGAAAAAALPDGEKEKENEEEVEAEGEDASTDAEPNGDKPENDSQMPDI